MLLIHVTLATLKRTEDVLWSEGKHDWLLKKRREGRKGPQGLNISRMECEVCMIPFDLLQHAVFRLNQVTHVGF